MRTSFLLVQFRISMQKKEGVETEIQIGMYNCIQQKNELFETFLLEVVNMYVRLECL